MSSDENLKNVLSTFKNKIFLSFGTITMFILLENAYSILDFQHQQESNLISFRFSHLNL